MYDSVHILLNIEVVQSNSTTLVPKWIPPVSYNLSNDFAKILANQEFSDVTIVAAQEGSEFKAHKSILCARSIVFATMFRHDFEESKTNHITIDDISGKVIQEMLNFIYTNRKIPEEMAADLYYAANKYQLMGLKNMCENILRKTMDKTSVLDILLLAERSSNERLKTSALEYIIKYIKDIKKTPKWEEFQKTNPQLIYEILCKVVDHHL
ncbi:TD and POZ domain-containing protein 4-like [Musca autumnalis]|uniref:TD and POZ domain-containing protein 4-like n=1 Tax=Musca autumnalis TaxID=221902 RepID=UPI003CFAF81E